MESQKSVEIVDLTSSDELENSFDEMENSLGELENSDGHQSDCANIESPPLMLGNWKLNILHRLK